MKRKAKNMESTQSSDSVPKKTATWGTDFEIYAIPLEILEEIFLNLPHHQVVCICRLVCRQWKEVADSESLWIERCRREGYQPCHASRTPSDWREFYFLCKKRRNLIKNPRGDNAMKFWEIIANGGDRWSPEGLLFAHPNEEVKNNFVTSYQKCMKSQLVDLVNEGYSPSFLDDFQPDVRVSDWYAPRWDCGSEYEINVQLLNENHHPIQTFAPSKIYFEQWNDQKWQQITHVFQNYGPGARYVQFTHGGKDRQFWAGWYGIRVTDSRVEICPARDT